MASSNRLTAVHFFLMFFVIATFILGAVAYVQTNDLKEREAAWEKTDAEKKLAETTLRTQDDQIQALKASIGHPFDSVGVGQEDNPSTVLGAMNQDLKQYGGPLAQQTYAATIQKLRQELDNITRDRGSVNGNLQQEHKQLLALQQQYQGRVDTANKARQAADAEKQQQINAKEEAVAAKDQEITQLRAQNTQYLVELEQEKERYESMVAEKDRDITNLSVINDLLREKIAESTDLSWDKPDGLVRSVDNISGLVWINLGKADRLPVRTSFSVYTKDNQGVGRGEEDIKGSIEVIRIVSDHLAECRILRDSLYDPIAPGDPIFTPLWSQGRQERFAFVGLIDFDGDKVSDRDILHDLIAASGAKIETEVDDQGNRTGGPLTVHTKYLVVGDIPEAGQGSTDEQLQVIEKMRNEHTELRKEARVKGITVISLNKFLSFIGYKPQRQTWVPGKEIPWNLRNGSASVGVNATLGNRESAGQVSGAYDRSKRLLQQKSTGQTSKLFRSGGY